jgi:hypothetical protein
MACPKCGCKLHYQYDTGWDGEQQPERPIAGYATNQLGRSFE